MKRALLTLATGVALSAGWGPARAATCAGDCSQNGAVSIDELIVGVGIALGRMSIERCPGFDREADGALTVDDLVAGVAASLGGCPQLTPTAPTATPTASPTPTPTRINRPPSIATRGVYRSFPDLPIELALDASDPDGDALLFAASRVPEGAALDVRSGVFTWQPRPEDLGPQCVAFRVTDEGSPPLSADGRAVLHIADSDPCAIASCAPASGCSTTPRPLIETCCANGSAERIAEPLLDCPDGLTLLVGRNQAGFGPLQSCDILRVTNFAQVGAVVRFHVAARCLDAAEQVRLRARLEILERREDRPGLIFDEEDDVFLDAGSDGFARLFDVVFPVIGPGPFFEFEGAEALFHVGMTDAGGVSVERDLRLVLTFTPVPDLPDPLAPTADEVCGSPTRTPEPTRTQAATATPSNTPRPPLPTATASASASAPLAPRAGANPREICVAPNGTPVVAAWSFGREVSRC